MIDLSNVAHHPAIEEIVDVLCNRTQNTDRGFFRTEVAYFMGKVAATMRVNIITKDRGEVPVNIYALLLATSGYGKGHSVNIIENDILTGFKKRFMEDTFPVIAEKNLWVIANDRAIRNGSDQQEEFEKVEAEFKRAGALPFTFDSGTGPAVKQLRQKLMLSACGAVNLQIDEIGSNLIGNVEILNLFLELYDQGLVKQKLTKNTADNVRGEELDGKTPTNMMLFGTPAKLQDGGQTEDQFYSFLETGYARRCLFGSGVHHRADGKRTAAEIYHDLIQPQNSAVSTKWAIHFEQLADPAMFGWELQVHDDVGIKVMEYKLACEREAEAFSEHDEIKKAEMSHRYFKALKLAGAYAFVDKSSHIDLDAHLLPAILLVEESGAAFQKILSREKPYVKLAKYMANVGTEVTHSDLLQELPFYGRSNSQRSEMMALATAWGYKEHIIIKKSFTDGIEFFKGETLKETDLNALTISYSNHWAYHYQNETAPFDQLHNLTQLDDYHWVNHHLAKGHRADENVKPGFNMVVIDCDGEIDLATAHELMKDYKFFTYTTKRHTETENRFRMVLPLNYTLELDQEEYKEFMNAVMAWLPFKSDESANQRAKKWMTYPDGKYHYNMDGDLLDARDFIPRTSRNETHVQNQQKLGSLDNIERWFAARMQPGNRNNQMHRYAMALVDSGLSLQDVRRTVVDFNKKLSSPLSEDELNLTVMTTVAKQYT